MTENYLTPPVAADPAVDMAARTLSLCARAFGENLTAADMLAMLERAVYVDGSGTETLFLQSQVLNVMFYRLTAKALTRTTIKGDPVPDHVDQAQFDLALRTQRLCRATLEAIHKIKTEKHDERNEGPRK